MPVGLPWRPAGTFLSEGEQQLETVKFLVMQGTALLFTVITAFIVGVAFGAGVWVAWRGLDRRAGGVKRS